ncbi:uncharacterized protein KGF55_001744 [Candida pseudojiufengensis]|uniref:uncharacterized protein n=1 Tax=Candida pseudojiufengensis TaxID=497109 RepID=UPI00222585A8|nr:uncharacterized protein KGF55_001744 [Candida pseudojiufengensis]KAI5964675.1 hypothetical protein KGF55_001744 [Candida pseudojiufengensis]
MFQLSAGENPIPDFEEALRVKKVDENNYIGAHALRLPVIGGRGVYGGHMIAQSLLVGIESTKNEETGEYFIPDSYHSHFINAGNYRIPMEYRVIKLFDDGIISKRAVLAHQKGKNRINCIITLRKQGTKTQHNHDESVSPPNFIIKHPNPDELRQTHHTDFVRNAYDDDFLDYRRTPEEKKLKISDRWITLFTGLKNIPEPGTKPELRTEKFFDAMDQPHSIDKLILLPKNSQSMKNHMFNYVGLADISDSAFITTLARVLHTSFAPALEKGEPYDEQRDATHIINSTLNAMHIFHYNAMSLDHHIYFHNNEYDPTDGSAFDVCKDWLTLTYQMKRLNNSRLLCRGYIFNENQKCIATIVQEGLTILFDGVGSSVDQAHL